ncbi:hypothetical protein WICMUC_004580 [Wickerhamomyces mucosus]|uniref:Deacetylase sirtuin-type domain-containing protein n=1 Tax=Wickerhamomyces mucosus TaxID=1378264 RepID=A0A9P8PI28_9ASCO|nr:hypothetical protein WICMUC_004580 [Wickerhamomyces mucosus]
MELNEIFEYLYHEKSIILTGAGISQSSGIPTFRCNENGIFNQSIDKNSNSTITSKRKGNGIKLKGKDLFDVSILQTNPEIFAQFINQLHTKIQTCKPSLTHKFIQNLIDNGKCIRNYTQNIDSLELNHCNNNIDKIIQLHGNINNLKCNKCNTIITSNWNNPINYKEIFANGIFPECPECLNFQKLRLLQGKRSKSFITGILKPDILLYGEFNHELTLNFINCFQKDLLQTPKILLIMGTSLKVYGIKNLIKEFKSKINQGKIILINKERLNNSIWNKLIDEQIIMETDEFVKKFNNWKEDLINHNSQYLNTPPSTPSIQKINNININNINSNTKRKLMITPESTPKKKVKPLNNDESPLNKNGRNILKQLKI